MTQVTGLRANLDRPRSFYCVLFFILIFFFNVIIRQLIYYELCFIICFDFISMIFFQSHDLVCGSDKLTHIIFWFFMKLSRSHDLGYGLTS